MRASNERRKASETPWNQQVVDIIATNNFNFLVQCFSNLFFDENIFLSENFINFASSKKNRGAFIAQAEIIPIEPDADNAAVGRDLNDLDFSSQKV